MADLGNYEIHSVHSYFNALCIFIEG